jgi:Bacterial Ig-like domain (group 2)
MTKRLSLGMLVALAGASAAGCGSGGGMSARGSLAMVVSWPARSAALLPQGAQSVRVTIKNGTGAPIAGPRLISRKQGVGSETVVFQGLTPGPIVVEVTAHGQPDGSDPPLSAGQASGMIQEGTTAKIAVSMNSTVAFVQIQPVEFVLSRGKTQPLTATAFDAQKRMLLGATFAWSTTNPQVATVDPTSGLVTAIGPGPVTIFAREEASAILARVDTFVQ